MYKRRSTYSKNWFEGPTDQRKLDHPQYVMTFFTVVSLSATRSVNGIGFIDSTRIVTACDDADVRVWVFWFVHVIDIAALGYRHCNFARHNA